MTLLPLYSVFGQNLIGVSIHDTSVVAGESVYVPVYIDSSLTGQNVTSFNFEFSFDDYYITIDSVITAGTLTDGWGSVAFNLTGSERFSVAGASSNDLSGTGVLFFLKVESVRQGGSWLRFASDGNNYFNEGSPGVVLDDGYISVSSPPSIDISPDGGVIAVGDTKDFNAYGGASPYTWGVTNPSIATINSDGTVTALSKGTTKIYCEDSNGIKDTTNNDLEIRAFKLTMRDTSFYQGNVVDIPIYTSDLTGLNYTAGQIDLTINAGVLTPVQIITTGTLLENYSAPQFSFIGNNFSIAFAGDTPLTGSGTLMIVRYQISPTNTSGTYLRFENILFNETDLGLGDDSYFDVLPLPTINVSPNTATLVAGETQTFTASSGTPPYTWSVSNPVLASISSDGVLTAIKGGVVTVHVQDTYGGSGNSGNINLYDTEVTIPDTTTDIGSSIDLPVYVGNLSSDYSVISLQAEITFDSSKVKFEDIVNTGTHTSGWSFSVNNLGNRIIIAGAGTAGFNTQGTIVKLRFSSAPGAVVGNYSNINFESLMFNEGSPNALTNNGRITFATLAPPIAPSSLNVTLGSTFEAELSWIDNSNNETGFAIERATDTTKSWTQIATVSANTTFYLDASVSEGTQYFYRVNAYNSVGNSSYSNTASVITPLNAPTDLSGSLDGVNNVRLTWTDNSSAESGYIIERHEYTSSFYVLDTVGTDVTTYIDSNLTFGEYYTYRVKAYNALTESDYSNSFDFTVSNPYPNPPSGLTATALDSAAIALAWSDNSANETGFMIERKIGATGSWTQMYSLPANSTDYTDNGLTDGMLYYYRVNAFNDAGNSGYSNVDSAITTMRPPRNLTAANPATGKVELNWVDFSASEEGFIIERAEGHLGESLLFSVIDTASANETSYIDSNLTTAEAYVYQIRAFNEYIQSEYSNMAPVTLVGINDDENVPSRYEVFQNYPNPFSKGATGNSTTNLKFSLPERSKVHIKVYNLLGCEVASLMSKEMGEGHHQIKWNAGDIPSGVYIISFRFEGMSNHQLHSFIKKAILLK